VVIKSEEEEQKLFAIECKFSEPYGSGHDGLSEKYINNVALWKDIPHLYDLARTISPKDTRFNHLYATQSIKHILGLKKNCGKTGFKLLYL